MKKTLIALTIVLLAGCQNGTEIKSALGDALIVGEEVRQIELAKGNTVTADRIQVWLDAGQNIYETGSYDDNCDLMLSVAGIAYDWIAKEYPDKAEYRIPVALLRSKLANYCDEAKP